MDLKSLKRAIELVEVSKAPGEEELDLVLQAAKEYLTALETRKRVLSLVDEYWDSWGDDSWGDNGWQ